jgi:hypothetical protein
VIEMKNVASPPKVLSRVPSGMEDDGVLLGPEVEEEDFELSVSVFSLPANRVPPWE